MDKKFRDILKETVSVIVIALVLALVLRNFVVEGRVITTASMLPTVQLQDRVLVLRFFYHFEEAKRGDVIMFQPPDIITTPDPYLKRVIGLPGETVEVKNEKVYINGVALKEPYLADPINYDYGPVVVPPGCLFVMGDNRNSSYDSHEWNAWLTEDHLLGKAIGIYWPLDHIKLLQREVSFE
ncbi:MAG: signal peptidase I [Syntrophomonas sp.]|nr:signal peptidase I [Syntrophomonas sp.]